MLQPPKEEQKTMSRKDDELNRAKKGTTDRRVSDKDLKKADRVNQASNPASNRIRQAAQEIADDEVTIAKTGSKP